MPFHRLRSLLFWLHAGCGVVAGVVILIMCATGVLLTYQRQIIAWSDMHRYRAGPQFPGMRPVPLDRLLATIDQTQPALLTSVSVWRDPEAPVSISQGSRALFVNAYTGEILGDGSPRVRLFFRRVTDWHRWLAAGADHRQGARIATGASNVAFLVLVVSGPFLWWPKELKWKQLRSIVWFRKGLAPKARDFNWHTTIGLWSAMPLAVIVVSGVVMSYPWANNLVYRVAGEQPPAPGRGGEGGGGGSRSPQASRQGLAELDELVARAAQERPAWKAIALRLPLPTSGPAVLTIDEGDGGQPQKRGTLSLNQKTCEVLQWAGFPEMTPGRRARTWLRFAHTGEFYGIIGQTVAGLASLGGVVLVWTGLALAFRRLLAWQKRPRSSANVRVLRS